MDKYLIDIIEKMLDTSDQTMVAGFDSSKTISWKALREAEKNETEDFIPQLILFIDNEKNKNKRDRVYFLLGHIAKNTNNTTAINYLIQRVGKETDKYVVASLLDRIADLQKPIKTDLQPLIQATKSDKWLIRHSAIQALDNSSDPDAETALIEILDSSDDPYNLTYANTTLFNIGTIRAIPHLEKHLKSRKRDVKNTAKCAIEEIIKRS
jgi:HEAT repeat protein